MDNLDQEFTFEWSGLTQGIHLEYQGRKDSSKSSKTSTASNLLLTL